MTEIETDDDIRRILAAAKQRRDHNEVVICYAALCGSGQAWATLRRRHR